MKKPKKEAHGGGGPLHVLNFTARQKKGGGVQICNYGGISEKGFVKGETPPGETRGECHATPTRPSHRTKERNRQIKKKEKKVKKNRTLEEFLSQGKNSLIGVRKGTST